jgi:O-antigen/teichoic acid export membrane protein
VLNRFIGFFLLPLYTAYLTPLDYGISSILGIVAFVAWSVFSLGLNAGIGPSYFEGNEEARKDATISTALGLLAGSGLVLAGLGALSAREISRLVLLSPEYGWLVALSLLTTAVSLVAMPFMLRLQFSERAASFVLVTVGSALASIAVTVVLVVHLRRGVQGLVEGALIGQLVNLALLLAAAAPGHPFRFSWPLAKELLRLSLPLMPSFACLLVIQHGNKVVLQWLRGLDEVGVYSIGFNIGLTMNLAVSAFQTAWYPYFMSFIDRKGDARHLFGRVLTCYVFGFGVLALLFWIGARPVVRLMTQASFHDAHRIVGPSAFAQYLFGIFYILLPGMYFAKEVQYVTLLQLAAAAFSVALALALIPPLGLSGAAVALVLGTLSVPLLTGAWNRRRRERYLAVCYEWGRVLRFGAVAVVYMAVAELHPDLPLPGEALLSLLSAVSLALVVYALLQPGERAFLASLNPTLLLASLRPGQR